MRPWLALKYRRNTGYAYVHDKTYYKCDTVSDYRNAWKASEVPGEYKYKIYFYEGNDTDSGGLPYGVQSKFAYGENYDSIKLVNGKLYTRGQYCEYLYQWINKFNDYGFGFTFKFVGYEVKKDSSHFNTTDVYRYYEAGKPETVGLDYNDESVIISNYSDHHFSIFITTTTNQGGGVPFVFLVKNETSLSSVHYITYQDEFVFSQLEHEILHSLFFYHVWDNSSGIGEARLKTYAPMSEGIVLNQNDLDGHNGTTSLGLCEDGIHGIDVIYNVIKSNHLKITGTVDLNSLEIAEAKRDKNGSIDGSGNYLGYSYALLIEQETGEIYYQSIVDSMGYYEFRIRIPNRYIRTVNNKNLFILIVSSYFAKNYDGVVRKKGYNGTDDRGVPIYWGKSDLIDLSGVLLPYILAVPEIKMNKATYPTETYIAGTGLDAKRGWRTDVYDLLSRDTGAVLTYVPFKPKKEQLLVNTIEEKVICGTKQ